MNSEKVRLATVWLDGCSGCHMSFLDIDERILEIAPRIELVHSPIMDAKEFPADVDVTLVEGAVSNADDLHKARVVRARSRLVVALGDCAVTGNVPAMRNVHSVASLLDRAYVENATADPAPPHLVVPRLTPRALPLHMVVPVDLHIPGCPPDADTIFSILAALLDGSPPSSMGAHFG